MFQIENHLKKIGGEFTFAWISPRYAAGTKLIFCQKYPFWTILFNALIQWIAGQVNLLFDVAEWSWWKREIRYFSIIIFVNHFIVKRIIVDLGRSSPINAKPTHFVVKSMNLCHCRFRKKWKINLPSWKKNKNIKFKFSKKLKSAKKRWNGSWFTSVWKEIKWSN